MNEIANYTDILNKTGLGRESNVCPNKSDVIRIGGGIKVNGSYEANQCVRLADIEKKEVVIEDESWIINLTNNSSNTINVLRSNVEMSIPPYGVLKENAQIKELIYHLNVKDYIESNIVSIQITGFHKDSTEQIDDLFNSTVLDGNSHNVNLSPFGDGISLHVIGPMYEMRLDIKPLNKYKISIWLIR